VKLTIDDIADLRAYERERDEFRQHVIQLKKRRRVPVGRLITLLFENRDTVRFQVQEMARVEKIISDEGIQHELDVYNPLIPEPGTLAATLFVELTSKDDLREWLPKLAGVERAVRLRVGDGADADVVPGRLDAEHEKQLTREETTASVHYLRFTLDPSQVARFAANTVAVEIDHPSYTERTVLSDDTKQELVRDLAG
jgi:hypothetical protein